MSECGIITSPTEILGIPVENSSHMSNPDLPIQRHQTVCVKVGHVAIGGGAPIVVQSMTNTDTADPIATAEQIYQLARAGSELVRITVNTD